jgi:photosystem II stability/assembly factor-like uncharacterized protein
MRITAILVLGLSGCVGYTTARTSDSGAGGADGRSPDARDRTPDGGDGLVRLPDSGPETPHTVLPCERLSVTGEWEDITPFQTPAGDNFGVSALAINPRNTAVVYLGTSAQGFFTSSDCGATWTKSAGNNSNFINDARQWTMAVSPHNPDIVYTNTGYNVGSAWKSINGGVDWEPLVPERYLRALQFGGFVHLINMDPTDPNHLIVTPHFDCETGTVDGMPLTANCLLETKDAGATWRVVDNTPQGLEGGAQWMLDSETWFWTGPAGLQRTVNGGESWEPVIDGGVTTPEHIVVGDALYVAAVFSLLRSTDRGATWSEVPGAPGTDVLATDGQTIFSGRHASFASASASDPTVWTPLPSIPLSDPVGLQSFGLHYDPDHKVLYSHHLAGGLWRLVLE